MTEMKTISESIQKFGLVFDEKQIYSIIKNHLLQYFKGTGAVFAYTSDGAKVNVNFIPAFDIRYDTAFLSVCEHLEPIVSKYIEIRKNNNYFATSFKDIVNFNHFGEITTLSKNLSGHDSIIGYLSGEKFEIKGSVIIPIYLDNKVNAIFGIISKDELNLTSEEISAITTLGYLAALSIKNLTLGKKVSELNSRIQSKELEIFSKKRQIEMLHELSEKLGSEVIGYSEIFTLILNAYSQIFGIKKNAVFSIDNQKNEFYIEKISGFANNSFKDLKIPVDSGLFGAVYNSRSPYFRQAGRDATDEAALIPFYGPSGLIAGIIALYDTEQKLTFKTEDFELMWLISSMFSTALNVLKLKALAKADYEYETNRTANDGSGNSLNSLNISGDNSPEAMADVIQAVKTGARENKSKIEPDACEKSFKIKETHIKTRDIDTGSGDRAEFDSPEREEAVAALYMQKKLMTNDKFMLPKFEIAAYCSPASVPGGDFYDVITNDKTGSVSLIISDISGKGIQAAMTAAVLRTQIRSLIATSGELRRLLFFVNNLMCDEIDFYNFITLFAVQIQANGSRAAFCNAGHNPILHYIKNGNNVVIHESKNFPVGIVKNAEFKEGILLLDSGDILLLYTNGLCEVKNKNGEFYGYKRLSEFLRKNSSLGALEFKEKLAADILEYSENTIQSDDVTFILVKVV